MTWKQLKFVIDGRLPSMNKIINVARNNRYDSAKLKKSTQERLEWIMKAQMAKNGQTGLKFTQKAYIRVLFFEPFNGKYRRDDDNVIAGCKFILDALQELGIIRNDSPKYCHLMPERFTDLKQFTEYGQETEPFIVVTITQFD
ncbi:hypothetical protein [Acidaminococcus sp.]|uniref:hypothetical protein n=1 Tax=Acidaminococcus sp. TaxID=1872103 RepID=UPI003D7EE2C0